MTLCVLKLAPALMVALIFGAVPGLSVPTPEHHIGRSEAGADKGEASLLVARGDFGKPTTTSMDLDFAKHHQLKLTVHSFQDPPPHTPVLGRIQVKEVSRLGGKPRIELESRIKEGVGHKVAPSLKVDEGDDPQAIGLHFPPAMPLDDVDVQVTVLLPRIANKDIAKWDIGKVEINAKHLKVLMDTPNAPIWDLQITSDNTVKGRAAIGVGKGAMTSLGTSDELFVKSSRRMIDFAVYPFVDMARVSRDRLGQLKVSTDSGKLALTMQEPVYSDNKWKKDNPRPFNYLETAVDYDNIGPDATLDFRMCSWRGTIEGGKWDYVDNGSKIESVDHEWTKGNERDRGRSIIRLHSRGLADTIVSL